jgi:putative ubiquitin-RnfH superfamily antitoxin RatB of RatAB toxin-antitoxin module
MADGDVIDIEVAYAEPDIQVIVPLKIRAGVGAREAVRQSGLLERFPGIDLNDVTLGVFGVRVAPSAPLVQGDRVEIYRPLQVDAKQARRNRAQASRGRQKS